MTVYTRLKLTQIATECGSVISPVVLGQLLADPRHNTNSIAAVLCTTPAWFERAMALPEPTVYPAMTSSNV